MGSKVLRGWHSGQVVRKHTMMNLRPENIAEHTWGVIHVLLSVWPDCPARTIIAAQYHDFGERATGDVPATTRWENPEVAKVFDKREHDFMRDNLHPYIADIVTNMTELEKLMIEFADRTEFCFSMFREINMGNLYGLKPFKRSFDKAAYAAIKILDLDEETWKPAANFWLDVVNLRNKLESRHGQITLG